MRAEVDSLVARFTSEFPSVTRRHGRALHEAAEYDCQPFGGVGLEALFSDGTVTTLAWLPVDEDWELTCDCDVECEHLWALVLEADALGLGSRTRGDAGSVSPPTDYQRRLRRLPVGSSGGSDPWRSVQAPTEHRVLHLLDLEGQPQDGTLRLTTVVQRRRKDGQWGQMKPMSSTGASASLLDETDRRLLTTLESFGTGPDPSGTRTSHSIPARVWELVLPELCRTGRLHRRHENELGRPLDFDGGPPWRFVVRLERDAIVDEVRVEGELQRPNDEVLDLKAPKHLEEAGFLLVGDRLARFDPAGAFSLAMELRTGGPIVAKLHEEIGLREALLPVVGQALEEATAPTTRQGEPVPRLVASRPWEEAKRLDCRLSFVYDGFAMPIDFAGEVVPGTSGATLRRNRDAERAALSLFLQLGGENRTDDRGHQATLELDRLASVVRRLVTDGWVVEAEGELVRRASSSRFSVRSDLDWFELDGTVRFDEHELTLPDILARRGHGHGHDTVRLDDGSQGLLPRDWLTRLKLFEELGDSNEGRLRFGPSQALLLDVLLSSRDDVRTDEAFERLRQRLATAASPEPVTEPEGFVGELRPYQREGLSWMRELDSLGLGGCLADDMGLGKTVQVLAAIQARKLDQDGDQPLPTLVVAPRSLVFNWLDEANRFTPGLKTFEHVGADRHERWEKAGPIDLVVTTYGTLRRDIDELWQRRFDLVVLDEAHAIKNEASQVSKAVRLLQAEQRLALTGTPVENSLRDLWSLFEFLNPGLLGRSSRFSKLLGTRLSEAEDAQDDIQLLRRALRPVMLRRTKEEVLPELPRLSELILRCPMMDEQREEYDELRRHYRAQLLSRRGHGAQSGPPLAVLEALLRLRQLSCHPGLLDSSRREEGSAKLDVLMPRLVESTNAGHAALVFSQFTSFLEIVSERLTELGLDHELLTGATRDREARVRRFRDDPSCRLFLISLKAGGFGLNLTKADYVFLLDPWWNPAAEAQAIDRSHRFGQQRPVLAYRLACEGTVEDKVLALQESKRTLADAVLERDEGGLSGLTPEELDLILS
ncbi:MAG: DEAD/DEAH box helicase [Acidobacteriota bacterium]